MRREWGESQCSAARQDPGAWFDAMDVDRTGDLDLDEVLGALALPSAHFPIWVWLKIKQEGQTAGFGPRFHLPGQPILAPVF